VGFLLSGRSLAASEKGRSIGSQRHRTFSLSRQVYIGPASPTIVVGHFHGPDLECGGIEAVCLAWRQLFAKASWRTRFHPWTIVGRVLPLAHRRCQFGDDQQIRGVNDESSSLRGTA